MVKSTNWFKKKGPWRNKWFRHRSQICIFSGLVIGWWLKFRPHIRTQLKVEYPPGPKTNFYFCPVPPEIWPFHCLIEDRIWFKHDTSSYLNLTVIESHTVSKEWSMILTTSFLLRESEDVNKKSLFSKISVDSNFTFSSYARLCVFHCSHRLGGGGNTQIWVGQGCAARASKPIPIFKDDFGQKGYPFQK